MITFAYPSVLLGLALLPLLAFWEWRSLQGSPTYAYAHARDLPGIASGWAKGIRMAPSLLRLLWLGFVIGAGARPYHSEPSGKRHTEGLDILLALDTSQSMLAMDFEWEGQRQNRLAVVKKVVEEFIARRSADRIGLVLFGSEAFTQAPLTLDHPVLLQILRQIEIGIAGPETAIGDALATGLKRMQGVDAPAKIMILLSDGTQTAGKIDPRQAAHSAQELKVRIYTIGVGSNDPVPFPVQGFFGLSYEPQIIKMDRELLQDLARETGGQYFEAADTETLQKVYETIDRLEKRRIEEHAPQDRRELGWILSALALLGLSLELLLRSSLWRVIP